MMTQNADKKREQMQIFCMDDMVPQDHLLRIIDKAINWNFIYDLVVDKYSSDNGRPSMDPEPLCFLVGIVHISEHIMKSLSDCPNTTDLIS